MRTYIMAALLAVLPTFALAETTTYGLRLEGFDYPHPTQTYAFESRGQTLDMVYMDIAPQGNANGKTVVLLHGKNFCAATWEGSIDVLAKQGYRVVAVDQIGFCKSSKPEGYQYSLSQLALNTHNLLAAIGVEKPIVMGHSMGGMLAMRYGLMYPQQTEKLVLVNPIGLEDWQAKGVPYAPIETLYAGELKTGFESIKNYQLKFYYNGVWKPEYDRWVYMQSRLYAGEGKQRVAMSQAQTSDMIFTQPVVHELPQLRVPTLLIIGGKDRTAPGANRAPKEIAETLGNYPVLGREAAAAIPDSTLVELPEMGHSPQVEAPAAFHKVLLENL